jgi:hypothetical protein
MGELMRSLIGFICFVFIAATGMSLDKVGSVVAVEGVLKATNPNQSPRVLSQDSDIFLGDTLITEASAKGQIQFLDGTLILLIPGSRYSVNSYADDKFSSKLSRGGVRVSTGLIAKKNPENFELRTGNATIGVRGTVFETRIYNGDLYVGSSSGNLSVTNQGGQLDIGAFEYASVSNQQSPPKPLAQRPAPLDLSNFELPAGGTPFQNGVTGAASVAGQTASRGFAWGPAIGGLALIGTVVGVIAVASSQSAPTFSATAH